MPFVIIVTVPLNVNKELLGKEALFLSSVVEPFLTNQEKSLTVQSRLQTYIDIVYKRLEI